MQETRTVPTVAFSGDLADSLRNLILSRDGEPVAMVFSDSDLHPPAMLPVGEAGVVVVSEASGLVCDALFWKLVTGRNVPTPVIVVADRDDMSAAVRMTKAGAYDVVTSSGNPERLVASIRSALAEVRGAAFTSRGKDPVLCSTWDLVGISPAMMAIHQTIASVAPSDAGVFIVGESGTGKELVARALHTCSRRSTRPFLAVNCAALPHDILENELFGHERGAFTGALNQKAGCFELASGGSLFLDEIGEMTSETQAKLLRVIEQQTFRRLGGKQEIRVDVRVIAATNRDVERSLEEGTLRHDLYYRLSVVEMILPPLRERTEDIPLLVSHFVQTFGMKYGKRSSSVSPECLEFLQAYAWPGNVRELRNAIERAVVICDRGHVDTKHLPDKILKAQRALTHIRIPIGSSVEEAEKKLILETLASVGNNKAKAARILGVSRKTLHNKLHIFADAAPAE